MAYDFHFFELSLQTLNWVAFAAFVVATLVYHLAYHWVSKRYPLLTVKGKVERYRKDWVEGVLQTRNILLAVQTIRNNIMATTWLAGSLLLVEAFLLTSGVKGESNETLRALGIVDHGFLNLKIDLLLILYALAFLMFLFSLRHLILFNTLIGTSAELITQIEGIEASEYLAQLINRAHTRFTWGLRATYFSIPAIAWLFSPLAFLVSTLLLWFWIAFVLDTRSHRKTRHLPA